MLVAKALSIELELITLLLGSPFEEAPHHHHFTTTLFMLPRHRQQRAEEKAAGPLKIEDFDNEDPSLAACDV